MDPAGTASRTAMMAACSRGWHLFSQGQRAVFADWLAWPLVGATAEELTAQLFPLFGDDVPQIAAWLAARQRIAEDWLDASAAEQYVVLGAGLDSYAWRADGSVRVFEVDHPATQTWKQSRLEAVKLSTPDHLTWVPVDFEIDSFAAQLTQSGLEARPTFFSWLGVTPYLTIDAIGGALDALPPCSLAVSYGTPKHLWSDECKRVSNKFLGLAAQSGEPILSLFSPEDFTSLLADHGFTVTEDVGHEMIESRFGVRALANGGERIALATKSA
jgi:methyltransferase (TIGR00027 family)